MHASLFGFFTNAENAITELINDCLLVAGGFLVGYVLGGVLAWAVGRYIFKQKDTSNFKAVGKPVCGAILAVIVAMIVFTGKGKPIGEGGDGKGSSNNDPNSGKSNPPNPNPDLKTDPKVSPPKVDIKPADVTLRVTVLGGVDVVNERFYLLDDDRTPKTFAELKSAIAERRAKEKGKVVVAVLFPTKNALPREHPAVTQIGKWAAEEAGLDVVFPAIK